MDGETVSKEIIFVCTKEINYTPLFSKVVSVKNQE